MSEPTEPTKQTTQKTFIERTFNVSHETAESINTIITIILSVILVALVIGIGIMVAPDVKRFVFLNMSGSKIERQSIDVVPIIKSELLVSPSVEQFATHYNRQNCEQFNANNLFIIREQIYKNIESYDPQNDTETKISQLEFNNSREAYQKQIEILRAQDCVEYKRYYQLFQLDAKIIKLWLKSINHRPISISTTRRRKVLVNNQIAKLKNIAKVIGPIEFAKRPIEEQISLIKELSEMSVEEQIGHINNPATLEPGKQTVINDLTEMPPEEQQIEIEQ